MAANVAPAKPWDARLAARLVAAFADTSLQPNHLTAVRLLVGVAAVLLFALGTHPLAASWVLVLSNFLDHTDGEFARMTGRFSRFGHEFDLFADRVVTVGLFVGIGIGLRQSNLGWPAIMMGLFAGGAVMCIFRLREHMERLGGKSATRQPQFAGFELEDILYLCPLVVLAGWLPVFLVAATLGAPLACLLFYIQYRRHSGAGGGL
ncbi:MAG: CDP-alcohol phosphatidyltransferase family protein [Gammaproteobacteria bacterium]|nr:CDP-alcohol phosphatidyltransferase family protein [Gammaproteobacteria bacterium]